MMQRDETKKKRQSCTHSRSLCVRYLFLGGGARLISDPKHFFCLHLSRLSYFLMLFLFFSETMRLHYFFAHWHKNLESDQDDDEKRTQTFSSSKTLMGFWRGCKHSSSYFFCFSLAWQRNAAPYSKVCLCIFLRHSLLGRRGRSVNRTHNTWTFWHDAIFFSRKRGKKLKWGKKSGRELRKMKID